MLGLNENRSVTDDVIFDGQNMSSDKFIRAIRRAALTQHRHNDDAWCAAFAASCLEGAALTYYEDLEENDQSNWRLLRAALLRRFPVEETTV